MRISPNAKISAACAAESPAPSAEFGVRPAKNKKLPNPLPAYKVEDVAAPAVIEGEAEEVEENTLIGHADGAG